MFYLGTIMYKVFILDLHCPSTIALPVSTFLYWGFQAISHFTACYPDRHIFKFDFGCLDLMFPVLLTWWFEYLLLSLFYIIAVPNTLDLPSFSIPYCFLSFFSDPLNFLSVLLVPFLWGIKGSLILYGRCK